MSDFLERISKLSPQRLALLAVQLNERVEAAEKRRRMPLAIVGMGCRMPGGADTPEEFWALLRESRDAVTEVPRSRWDVNELYDANPDTPGKMSTRWGGFVDAPEQFDAKFWGIAPAEADSMDPQQRLLLETSWEALENAGIAPSSLAGSQTGVFVGICNADYSHLALRSLREQITPYFAPGVSHAVAAGRISYVLGLRGPNLAVDTSCSASLVAVHLACQSLRMGECDAALAGGVNLILNPEITIALSQSRMMAPDGRCKAFSDLANGFVRGEGCGIVVLKRLEDAERDNDRILAVIRGSATNQDGRSSGLTAPNGPSQEAVVRAALKDAGLAPEDIDWIEAHGTGTSLGDPIEAGALNEVFSTGARRTQPLWLGSVKTNIGHLESAAGVAGLMKLVLALEHGGIPASLHSGELNHRVEWERLPLRVPSRLEPWTRQGEKKRAGGVSSFGFSGTNAHVIVEEYAERERPAIVEDREYLFPLSARTEAALRRIAERLRDHLLGNPSLALADVAYTLERGRSHFEHRAALIAGTAAELVEKLEAPRSGEIATGKAAGHAPRVGFVFGAAMAAGNFAALYRTAQAFRATIDQAAKILARYADRPLDAMLVEDAGNLPFEIQQARTVALEVALAEQWRSCGIEPAAAMGIGAGEIAAACVAGVFRLEDALALAVAASGGDLVAVARGIEYRTPQMPLIGDANRGAVNTAEFWMTRKDAAANWAEMAKENCAAHVVFGTENGAGLELRRLLPGGNSGHEFLQTAAALYILGCNPDLTSFYGDGNARPVALPTYPFERERYWLEARSESLATPQHEAARIEAAPQSSIEDDWIYTLDWEPKPLAGSGRQQGAAPLDELIGPETVTPATPELMRIAHLAAAMKPVYTTIILDTLAAGGLVLPPETALTAEQICGQLKIPASRFRILDRLLAILVEDGIVEYERGRYRFIDAGPRPGAAGELERLSAEYPECRVIIQVLARCSRKLLEVLRGQYDPMHLVFAEGSIDEAEHIYENSVVCRFFNERATALVQAAADRLDGRPLRILEIGGGTGATTRPVLAGLEGRNYEYCFTDVSPVFLSEARKKFSQTPHVVYRVLNVESDPIPQGFKPGRYDVVIAANVLHATADLRQTVAHARQLLAPDGILLLIEGVYPDRWLDMTFGLTDGWFRFTDLDLRPEHPLVSAAVWAELLAEAGMHATRTISYREDDGSLSQQAMILAQVDAKKTAAGTSWQEWILLADQSGVGEELARLLTNAGERCELLPRPSSAAAMEALLESLGNRPGAEVVYLWGLDTGEPKNREDLRDAAVQCCGDLVRLIQGLLAAGRSAGHLSIVTEGAQAAGATRPGLGGAIQATAWGIGRVLEIEAAEHYRGLIDLDPAAGPAANAALLARELLAHDNEDQIAYRSGERFVARLERSSRSSLARGTATPRALRADGSYLVTGGLGGIGLRLARWAAEQRPGHLVLLSRSGLNKSAGPFAAERDRAIEEIRAMGVKLTVVEGDVASTQQMNALLARFGTEFPPLRGIFHAATVVSVVEMKSMTGEQMEAMLRAKVEGTWLLDTLTRSLPLDFFIAFSSTASLLGAWGLAHYAAANQFMDALAHARRAAGLPMLSVNWGVWDVVRNASHEEQELLGRNGILAMDSGRALSLFRELTASRWAQVMIANIDWNIAKPLFESHRRRPLLEALGSGSHEGPIQTSAATIPPTAALAAAVGMGPADRKRFLERFVMEQAAQVLGFRKGEQPPVDVPLPDIGLDSLMAVDLKNRLQAGLGQELSPTIVFDYPTVTEMVELLETMLWAAHGSLGGEELVPAEKDEIHI